MARFQPSPPMMTRLDDRARTQPCRLRGWCKIFNSIGSNNSWPLGLWLCTIVKVVNQAGCLPCVGTEEMVRLILPRKPCFGTTPALITLWHFPAGSAIFFAIAVGRVHTFYHRQETIVLRFFRFPRDFRLVTLFLVRVDQNPWLAWTGTYSLRFYGASPQQYCERIEECLLTRVSASSLVYAALWSRSAWVEGIS